jgi:hypothetical protein
MKPRASVAERSDVLPPSRRSTGMPRYFFHVQDSSLSLDEDGTEFPDIYTAQAEAIRTSGEILRDMGARFWDGTEWRLEVADERGRVLFILRFSAEERPVLARGRGETSTLASGHIRARFCRNDQDGADHRLGSVDLNEVTALDEGQAPLWRESDSASLNVAPQRLALARVVVVRGGHDDKGHGRQWRACKKGDHRGCE